MRKLFYYAMMCVFGLSLAFTSCNESDVDVPLNTPSEVKVTSKSDNSATLVWGAVENAQGYITQLKNGSEVTDKEVSSATVTFENLQAETAYSFRVKASTASSLLDSEFSAWLDFTTEALPVLATPANLALEKAERSSLTIVWDAVPEAVTYLVEYKETENIESVTVDQPKVTLEQLAEDTKYMVRVKASDTQGLHSSFTEWTEFATLEGDIATEFKGGDGSVSNPYLIATPGQLALMAQRVNAQEEQYADGHYKLDADIDLGGRQWTPVGGRTSTEDTYPFRGDFDGNGFVISNINCTLPDKPQASDGFAGLFGENRGVIRNVHLTSGTVGNPSINSNGGICGINFGEITGCTNAAILFGRDLIGGIAGQNQGEITLCVNKGSVTGSREACGGITGYTNRPIKNSENEAEIRGEKYAGGIVGYISNESQNNAGAENCINRGNVSSFTYTGGITGYLHLGLVVSCTNYGEIKGNQTGNDISYTAGIAAYGQAAILRKNVNHGKVSGYTYVAGIVGQLKGGNIDNCINMKGADIFSLGSNNGGIVGRGQDNGQMYGCANYANITTTYGYTGGVAGYHQGTMAGCVNAGTVTGGTTMIGGVVGYVVNTITACYNTGHASGTNNVGGVVGYINSGTLALALYNTGTIAPNQSTAPENIGFGMVVGHVHTTGKIDYSYYVLDNIYGGVGTRSNPNQAEVVTYNLTDYWPEENIETGWGICDKNSEKTYDKGYYWLNLGTKGSNPTYPVLWWEESASSQASAYNRKVTGTTTYQEETLNFFISK